MHHRLLLHLFSVLALLLLLFVPAGISRDPIAGKWNFAFEARGWAMEVPVTLQLDGEEVTAKTGDVVVNGTFRNNHLVLSGQIYANETGYEAPVRLSGSFRDGEIHGDVEFDVYEATFTARRAD